MSIDVFFSRYFRTRALHDLLDSGQPYLLNLQLGPQLWDDEFLFGGFQQWLVHSRFHTHLYYVTII